jgi:predicted lysophospholipase L1 biosynthesis ABC-type transport system permease subunit
VTGYTAFKRASLTLDGVAVAALGLGDGGVQPVMISGAVPRDGEVALGPGELRSHHLAIGDLVPSGNGASLRVVGTTLVPATNGRGVSVLGRGALVSWNSAGVLASGTLETGFLVRLDPSDVDAFVTRFRSAFSDQGEAFDSARQPDPITVIDYRRVGHRPTVMASVLAAFAIVTMMLGLIGSLHRRSRDFAVLRALGFTPRDVGSSVLAQTVSSSVAVLLVGLPIGLVTGAATWSALERRVGTNSASVWPVWPIVAGVGLGFVVLVVSISRPVSTIQHHHPGESLRSQ